MFTRFAGIAALACLAVALTGCSETLSTRTTVNAIPPRQPLQLTGAGLKSALLPLSDFPVGYVIDTQASGDTGSTLLPGSPATATPQDCLQLEQVMGTPSTGLTAAANEDLDDTAVPLSDTRLRRYGQAIFQFSTPSGSTGYLNFLRSAVARCPAVLSTKSSVKMALKETTSPVPPVAGHEAFLLQSMGTANGDPVHSAMLYTVAGTDVYLVGATVFGVPFTAQPSSFAALTAKLIARVQAIS